MIARFYGVDPGLVHTGLVRLQIDTESKSTMAKHWLMDGCNPSDLPDDFTQDRVGCPRPLGWVEGYRPRTNLPNDRKMQEAVSGLCRATGFPPLDNMGVKKVVRKGLMKELHLWQFSSPSHHQDLRSAAYIMLFGMLKDPKWNKVLTNMVQDWYYGRSWSLDVES